MLAGNIGTTVEHTMAAITQSTALWYASRATGVVSMLLLSVVVILGILVNRQGRLPGLPSFAVTGLHRSLSLLAVVFVAVHVATAVLDPFVSIGVAAVVVPFVSPYEPLWLGLGAVSLDLVAALIVTSLVRAYLSRRAWRGIHWLAYAAWPLALAHSFGSSSDLRSGGFLLLAVGCALAVAGAALWRLASTARQVPRAERAAAALVRTRRHPGSGGLARAARASDGGAR